ncbi:MAG: response regulator transcription factor, partial [Proteobacteria bacterium]
MASYLRLVDNNKTPDQCVLLVDTDIDLVRGLSTTLMNYGFIVQHATDWPTMVQCLHEAEVDLVLMEQRLGCMDMVQHLNRIIPLTKAPVVFLADNLTEADRILALELGAADFLQKLFSMSDCLSPLAFLYLHGAEDDVLQH